jgi:Ca2+/Na+ antiporter
MSLKYWIRSKHPILWIQSRITLRRQGYLYVIFLAVFIIASIYFREQFLFQVGVTLFSIAVVYLVMKESNIELRETTEKQIKAFVENIQAVCSELKNVSSRVDTLSDVMKDVQRAILKSTLVSEDAIAKEEAERRKRKESIKPQLSVKVELRGFHFIVDLRRYHLIIWNSGSDAIGTIVQIRNLEYGVFNIGTREKIDIDIGHMNEFKGISRLNVQIKVRDVDMNLYQGNVQVSLPQARLISVPLTER